MNPRRTIPAKRAIWLVLCVAAMSSPAQLTNGTEETLRTAIAAGGTITFAQDCTITLSNTITIAKDTTLDGGGRQVMVSGGNAVRVFQVETNVNFTVIHLAIGNGYSSNGAAIYNAGGKLFLTGSLFQSNTVSLVATLPEVPVEGGAICNCGGTVQATNCVFTDNRARQPTNTLALNPGAAGPARGAALCNQSGTVLLQNCRFISNSVCGAPGNGSVAHAGSEGAGGAIHNSGTLTVNSCTFLWNSASGGMAGTLAYAATGLTAGAGSGGAICNLGELAVTGSGLLSNSVSGGQGSNGSSGPNNSGGDGDEGGNANGGAVFNAGVASIANSALVGNLASGGNAGSGGSGADAGPPPSWPMPGGIGGNGGSALGAALCNSGVANVCNSTFAANLAYGGAGGGGGACGRPNYSGYPPPIVGRPGGNGGSAFGALCDTSGLTRLTNCTLALNSAYSGIGGPAGWSPVLPGVAGTNGIAGGLSTHGAILVNTLLATNSPQGSNCVGQITDAGHNLSSDNTPAFGRSSSHSNADPLLGPLALNGGPTLTMALLPGSSAIDAGDTAAAPRSDQRDHPRPVGMAADIGAYEFGSAPTLRLGRVQPGDIEVLLYDDLTGSSCELLASTDLVNWAPVITNQMSPAGLVLFRDTRAVPTPQFYRARQMLNVEALER